MAVVGVSNLSSNLEKKAESELQEKVEWRERDILALKDMVLNCKFLYFFPDLFSMLVNDFYQSFILVTALQMKTF